MSRLSTPDQFKTRNARIVMGVLGLILTCAVVTRALDTGSWWQYGFSLLLLILSFRLFSRTRKS